MDIPPIIKSSFLKVSLKRKGDLITAKDGGQPETISVGEDGNVLIADSSTASGIKWAPGGGGSAVWGVIAGTLSNQVDLQSSLDGKEPADPEIQTHLATTGNPHGTTKADIGLDNLTNDAQIPKNIGAASGSLIGFSGPGTPVEILPGTDGQVLAADSTSPAGLNWVDNAAVANWQVLAGKPEITIGDSSPAGCDTLANALARGDYPYRRRRYLQSQRDAGGRGLSDILP